MQFLISLQQARLPSKPDPASHLNTSSSEIPSPRGSQLQLNILVHSHRGGSSWLPIWEANRLIYRFNLRFEPTQFSVASDLFFCLRYLFFQSRSRHYFYFITPTCAISCRLLFDLSISQTPILHDNAWQYIEEASRVTLLESPQSMIFLLTPPSTSSSSNNDLIVYRHQKFTCPPSLVSLTESLSLAFTYLTSYAFNQSTKVPWVCLCTPSSCQTHVYSVLPRLPWFKLDIQGLNLSFYTRAHIITVNSSSTSLTASVFTSMKSRQSFKIQNLSRTHRLHRKNHLWYALSSSNIDNQTWIEIRMSSNSPVLVNEWIHQQKSFDLR